MVCNKFYSNLLNIGMCSVMCTVYDRFILKFTITTKSSRTAFPDNGLERLKHGETITTKRRS